MGCVATATQTVEAGAIRKQVGAEGRGTATTQRGRQRCAAKGCSRGRRGEEEKELLLFLRFSVSVGTTSSRIKKFGLEDSCFVTRRLARAQSSSRIKKFGFEDSCFSPDVWHMPNPLLWLKSLDSRIPTFFSDVWVYPIPHVWFTIEKRQNIVCKLFWLGWRVI